MESHDIKVHKVSGSLTNAVFFVSCPSVSGPRTLLLRIYGASSGSLISRPRELHTLHILSSQYGIGPKIYGTFENGRIEEYFESTTLTASDLRDPEISRWIGARMAELHSVDIETIEQTSDWQICVKENITSWLSSACEVLSLPSVSDSLRQELDLERFKSEWNAYWSWLKKVDNEKAGSQRVFAHNDAQYGNLLRITAKKQALLGHRQVSTYCSASFAFRLRPSQSCLLRA
jgi:choline kinase